jgi:hypothetical protein
MKSLVTYDSLQGEDSSVHTALVRQSLIRRDIAELLHEHRMTRDRSASGKRAVHPIAA